MALSVFLKTLLLGAIGDPAATEELVNAVQGGEGSGTVTSVGISLPADFTVSNSPVTSSGTLTAVRASQTQNKVLASPNGSSGAPVYRALVAADVPTLNQNTTGSAGSLSATLAPSSGGTGQTSYTDGQLLIGNSTGNTLTKASLVAGSNISITPGPGSITIASTGAGANVNLSNLGGSVQINRDLIPDTNNNYNLGSESQTWAEVRQHSSMLFGSTSGAMRIKAADATTPYDVKMPAAQGGATTNLQNDGSGNLSWAAAGGGANTALSNLASTAVNADILSDATPRALGSASFPFSSVYAGTALRAQLIQPFHTTKFDRSLEISIPDSTDAFAAGNLQFITGFSTTGAASGEFGFTTPNSASGTSGSFTIITGTAGTTRGDFSADVRRVILNPSEYTDNSSKLISNVLDPVSAQDAATKNYVDSNVGGVAVAARAHSSSTTISGSLATIVFSTEDYDTNTAYDNTTGIFTAPSTGYYQVNSSLLMEGDAFGGQGVIIEVQKNGSVYSRKTMSLPDGHTSDTISVSDIVNLSATDTLRIQLSTDVDNPLIVSSAFDNYLSISKV